MNIVDHARDFDRLALQRELLYALAAQMDSGIPNRELATFAKQLIELMDELHYITPEVESPAEKILRRRADRGANPARRSASTDRIGAH